MVCSKTHVSHTRHCLKRFSSNSFLVGRIKKSCRNLAPKSEIILNNHCFEFVVLPTYFVEQKETSHLGTITKKRLFLAHNKHIQKESISTNSDVKKFYTLKV